MQVTNGTYDLETSLALLRLYNFDPDTVNVGLLAAVLLKAMTQLPEPDFHLLLHLIPERCQVRRALSSAECLHCYHYQQMHLSAQAPAAAFRC